MRFYYTIIFTFLTLFLFGQNKVNKDLSSLFLGMSLENKPEDVIKSSPLKFEKFTRKEERTGESIVEYQADFQKSDAIITKLIEGTVRIEQKNYQVKLGEHTIYMDLTFKNYNDVLAEYNRIFKKFEVYSSNYVISKPENESEIEGKQIDVRFKIKDEKSVKYLTLLYSVPKKEDRNKQQHLFVIFQFRKY